jgi:hypothetical protein
VYVFTPLGQNGNPVMTIQNGSVRPSFKRAVFARQQRRFQFIAGASAELIQLHGI